MKESGLYPIGTILKLKGAAKPIIITSVPYEYKGKKYDYLGLPYPFGYMDERAYRLFNREDIDEVYFYGFLDKEQSEYLKYINQEGKDV